MKKRSKALLISGILGALYMIYIIYYCITTMAAQTDGASQLGTGIGIALITPHIICVVLAVIFNWIGWAGSIRWAALVGAIMYCVAAAIFILYAPFVLVQLILSFVGFAKLKKLNQPAAPAPTQSNL